MIARGAVWHWRARLRILPGLPPRGAQDVHRALVQDVTEHMDCEDRRLSGIARKVHQFLNAGQLMQAEMVMTEWLGEG